MTSCVNHICANVFWVSFWQECICIQVSVSENCPIQHFQAFLLQAEGARGTEEVHTFQLCASSPWRAPKLSWKRITSSSWHNSVQSKTHFNPLSWWSAREGGHYRKGGRQAASKPSIQPPPHTPLSCIHFMCNATHTFSKDLLHFKLLENQKVSLLLTIKLCQSQFLK